MYLPETQLYIEVISQAMRDALGMSGDQGYNPYVKAQAVAWFDVNNRNFKFVCTTVGLSPAYVIKLKDKFATEKKNFVRNFKKDRNTLIK